MFPVGSFLAVFSFLARRTAAMSAGDVLLFLCLRLHLAIVLSVAVAAASEAYTILKYLLKIVFHSC